MKITTLNPKTIKWDTVSEKSVIRITTNNITYEITDSDGSLIINTISKTTVVEPRASNSILVSTR